MSIEEKIDELEAKGIRVCISPQYWYGEWYWYAGIYVGNERKIVWINSDNGLPDAAYSKYKDAFDAIIAYCDAGQSNTRQVRGCNQISRKKV